MEKLQILLWFQKQRCPCPYICMRLNQISNILYSDNPSRQLSGWYSLDCNPNPSSFPSRSTSRRRLTNCQVVLAFSSSTFLSSTFSSSTFSSSTFWSSRSGSHVLVLTFWSSRYGPSPSRPSRSGSTPGTSSFVQLVVSCLRITSPWKWESHASHWVLLLSLGAGYLTFHLHRPPAQLSQLLEKILHLPHHLPLLLPLIQLLLLLEIATSFFGFTVTSNRRFVSRWIQCQIFSVMSKSAL